MSAAVIERSLEVVAEQLGDPTPRVYQRLFELAPDLQALFIRDSDASVRGQMMQQVFETVLDLVGERHYADGLISTEWTNHQNIGVPAHQFTLFFTAMIDTFRDALGAHWTPEFDAAWQAVIDQVTTITARAAQQH